MSGFTDPHVDTINEYWLDASSNDNPTGNTNNIPIITNAPLIYHPGFPEYDRHALANVCDYCRALRCTNPECEKLRQADDTDSIYNQSSGYYCSCCCNFFNTEAEMIAHEDSNLKQYSAYYCSCCSNSFNTAEEMVAHDENKCWNKYRLLHCNSCGQNFENEADLLAHDESKCWDKNQEMHCKCCGVPVGNSDGLIIHDHHGCYISSIIEDDHEMWREWEEGRILEAEERLANLHEKLREAPCIDEYIFPEDNISSNWNNDPEEYNDKELEE